MANVPSTLRASRWWVLMTLSLIQLMVTLDVTVINVALPAAQRTLGFSAANRQWLITAYALAFGSLMLVGGRLSDLWGRRRTLVGGLVGFALASALGGDAHHFTTLVVARGLQGAFGALLAPSALAALTTTFVEARERSRAFSLYGAVGASGIVLGLMLGGALTQWASWRWCLLLNVVLAAIALVGVLTAVERDDGHRGGRFDTVGTVLGTAGLFFLVYGFSHAVASGWGSTGTWLSLVAATLLLVAFVKSQDSVQSPLLALRVVLNRTRGGSLIALAVTTFGLFGASLLLAYYCEFQLGLSPLRTGLYFVPLVLAVIVTAAVASARLLGVVGPRPLVPVGMVLAAMGMILFTRLTPHADYGGHLFPGLLLLGLGLGLIFAPAAASATAAIEARDAGAASAMVNAAQQVGGSIGTPLLNTIAVSVTARVLQGDAAPVSHRVQILAVLHGYHVAFWWLAGCFLAGAIVTFFMLESGVPEYEGDVVPLF